MEDVISVAVVREPFGKRFQTTGLDSLNEASANWRCCYAPARWPRPWRSYSRNVPSAPPWATTTSSSGFKSVIIGFALVLVFMAIYYRVFGLVANVALFASTWCC